MLPNSWVCKPATLQSYLSETDTFIHQAPTFSQRGRNTGTLAEGEPWHALARSLVTELQTITAYSYFFPRYEFCKNNFLFLLLCCCCCCFPLRPYIFPLTLSLSFQSKWLKGRKKKSSGTALNANTEPLLHVEENLQAKLVRSRNKIAVSITRHEHHNTVRCDTSHRVTEWTGLEGAFKDHLLQPPAMTSSTRSDCTEPHPT